MSGTAERTPLSWPLHLSRAEIRPWRRADASSLARHANDRDVWANLRDAFPHPYSIEDAHRYIERACAQDPATSFAIAVGGEAAGGIGYTLHQDIERLSAELGYWLARPFWNQGITTEAVRAVTAHALAAHGLVRVYALPLAANRASCRVLEKAGYACEGRMRRSAVKDGVVQDQFLYAYVVEDAPSR
jgi:RimJ/RimL family protein N-acetyltransferase